jgi:CRP-like cAMP-binding protein
MQLGYDLTPEDLQKISSYLKPLKLKKGENFISEGKKNDKIGIMSNGLMISTYISKKGKEEVSRIYSEINGNIIVSNHESFYYDTYSTENIRALVETTLKTLSKSDLPLILIQYPELENTVKDISEKSYINAIERIKEFQSYSAKERIRIHYNKHKRLFSEISKQHLASYLGTNRNDFTKFLNEIVKE